MKISANNILIESYYSLLSGLGRENKIKLIARLSNSIAEAEPEKNGAIDKLFGAFVSEKSAEEIIEEIRSSRSFNRKIEAL